MTLYHRIWGADGAPVCVALHGITANTGAWALIGPRLAELGLRVIAPDLRGHGESPADGRFDTASLLADLAEVVPHDPALLIGHSFGGYLAQRAILDGVLQPKALLLEDPVSHQPSYAVAADMLAHDRAHLPRSVEGILEANPGWSRLDAAWKVLSLEQVNWAGAEAAFAGNAPWDVREEAATVAELVPTVWMLPGESRFVPEDDLRRLHDEVGEKSVVVAAAAGHSIHRDEADLFLDTVRALLRRAGVLP
jgi:pimeloyl-ACP methyl ester carboxylesterase